MTTQEILEAACGAKAALALADGTVRAQALRSMAAQLCSPANITAILAANADDMAAAKGRISEVMLDRLALTEERIRAMAKGIEEVAALPDPVGRVLKRVERPNGLVIEKTAVWRAAWWPCRSWSARPAGAAGSCSVRHRSTAGWSCGARARNRSFIPFVSLPCWAWR